MTLERNSEGWVTSLDLGDSLEALDHFRNKGAISFLMRTKDAQKFIRYVQSQEKIRTLPDKIRKRNKHRKSSIVLRLLVTVEVVWNVWFSALPSIIAYITNRYLAEVMAFFEFSSSEIAEVKLIDVGKDGEFLLVGVAASLRGVATLTAGAD